MPVQIGGVTHGFSQPTELLADCHRRIEMFLGSLDRIAGLANQPLNAESRTALETALRYFCEAAPKHTADEEESLFPRLRQKNHPEIEAAIQALAPLEQDHRRADSLHAEVDRLGRRCLEQGRLPAEEATQFRKAMAELLSIYREHIRIEDEVVFPVAGRMLTAAEKSAIAGEMADRRK